MNNTYYTGKLTVEMIQQVFKEIDEERKERCWVTYGSPELIDKLYEQMHLDGWIQDNPMIEFPISYYLNGKEIKSLKRRRNRS